MQIDRTTLIQGPALVTYGGQTFWSKGDVTLKPVIRRFTLAAAHVGRIHDRTTDIRYEITFEPCGRINAALAAILWPYGSTLPGTSVFGATDSALVVHGRDGVKITFANAALTQMPSFRASVQATVVGALTFTALVKNDIGQADAGAYYAWATAAYPGDTGFDPATMYTLLTYGMWGSSPWDEFTTEAGFEVAFNLALTDVPVDGIGTVDMKVTDIGVTASAIPIGVTAEEVTTAIDRAKTIGSAPSTASALEISNVDEAAGSPSVTLTSATMVEADVGYGTGRKRVGRCTWRAERTFTSGTPDALFTVDIFSV